MSPAARLAMNGAASLTGLPRACAQATPAATTSRKQRGTQNDRRLWIRSGRGLSSLLTLKTAPVDSRRSLECRAVADLLQSWNADVFLGVISTVGKIALICGMINILTRTEQLPANASSVLSKVAYELIIPCLMFTRVTSLLSSGEVSRVIYGLTVAVFMQVVIGGAIGYGMSMFIRQEEQIKKPEEKVDQEAVHDHTSSEAPVKKKESSSATLLVRPGLERRELATLVSFLCAFGNIWTLPVLFLQSLFPGQTETVIGYLAFCIVGWSPLFWGLGPISMEMAKGEKTTAQEDDHSTRKRRSKVMAVLSKLRRMANKPTIAIVLAMASCSFPFGRALLCGSTPQSISGIPYLAKATSGLTELILDAMRTIASASIAVQTIILGAALSVSPVSKDSSKRRRTPSTPKVRFSDFANGSPETQAFMLVMFVRFLIMPFVGLLSLWAVSSLQLLPANDDMFQMTILILSVMPPAQNAVVLFDLQPKTRHLVPLVARMLVGMYVISVVPVTLWVTYFSTQIYY